MYADEWLARLPLRFRVEGGPELNAVIVTLGLFVAIQASIAIIFGSSFQSFPTPFGVRGFEVGGTTIPAVPAPSGSARWPSGPA